MQKLFEKEGRREHANEEDHSMSYVKGRMNHIDLRDPLKDSLRPAQLSKGGPGSKESKREIQRIQGQDRRKKILCMLAGNVRRNVEATPSSNPFPSHAYTDLLSFD